MGTIEIFANNLYFYMAVFSLLLLFCATLYTSIGTKQLVFLWLFFGGVLFDFFGNWFGYTISAYHNKPHFDFLVFTELCILLISLTLMALAAFNILMGKKTGRSIIWGLLIIAVIAISYFIFVLPNGNMISSMRTVFPLVGFLFMATAFAAKSRYGLGYKIASIATSAAVILLTPRLFGIYKTIDKMWYVPIIAYILLAAAILIIKADFLSFNLKESREKVKSHANQIENIIKSSPFPILISKLSDDKIIVANNNAIKLFGIKENELERYKLKDFFVDQDNRRLLNEYLEKEKEIKDFEILVKTAVGNTPFWLLTSANIIDYNHDITVYLAFQDITSRKNREDILKSQATRDPLTSLYNRRYFEEEVGKIIKKTNSPFCILMLDVDRFKNVNDTYGHKIGDQVLIGLAELCEKELRDNDIIARYGGEEFVVYLNDINEEKSKAVAERLREKIKETKIPVNCDDFIQVTVSIGIATSRLSNSLDDLVKMADVALYKAKNNGRNRTEIFETDDVKDLERVSRKNAAKKFEVMHPAFAKEEIEEISLLDGIEAKYIADDLDELQKETNRFLANFLNPKNNN